MTDTPDSLRDRIAASDRRVIVTGSRNYADAEKVHAALYWELEQTTGTLTVVHGGCPTGADAIAEQWVRVAALAGLPVRRIEYKADWDRLGKSAGPIRNARMVSDGADVVLAFPLGQSRGTRNTMKLAATAGIPVRSVDE